VEETATEAIVDNSETEQEQDTSPTEVKKEVPEVKAEESEKPEQVPVVKKEESLAAVVQKEDGNTAQCSASDQGNDEILKKTDVTIDESKVKIEPNENNHSLIKTEQNKVDTNGDDAKSGTVEKEGQ